MKLPRSTHNRTTLTGSSEAARVGRKIEFRQPPEVGDMWKEMMCIDCRTGLNP